MGVTELSRDALNELKVAMLMEDGKDLSWGEIAGIDSLVSDTEVFSRYAGVTFVEEDFCSEV